MADTKDRYALAKLIDDMVSDAILAGKSEALKCLGQFTPTEGVTVSVLHRSISQKRAQLIGYFDETTTPPADAAIADELLRLAGAFDMSLNNAASVSMNRRAADSLRKTLMQAAAALRALAVPEAVAKDALRDVLASLDGIATVTPKYWEVPRDQFIDEFLPWAQSRARDSAKKLRAILSATDS